MSTSNFEQRRRLLIAGASAAGLALPAVTALAQAPATRTLRIGNQKGVLSFLKARGTLEKRLAPLGVNVTWTEFNAGPVQLEALNVGSIDFGDVGEAPPIFAQAAGAPLVYVAATAPLVASEAIVVPKASAIQKVGDLKGKKIAYNKGSNVQFFLAKLLEKNGLAYNDVQHVHLAPADARAAFVQGSVDAWVIWDPFLAAAQKNADARLLADATGVVNNRGYYFSSRSFADKNADILRIAVEEVAAIDKWFGTDRAAAAAEYAAILGLDRSVAELTLQRRPIGTVPVTKAILAEQQVIADTFFELKLLPRKISILEAALAGVA
ncbi:MAG: sulfonate ABC transporter substrate-binding protein [Burkholderiales bacterium]|nr:sulfonate ABC transporter substrate-binding protein [Burkholderiales bacterium]